tara:strand:+ start:3526 stop:3735 length:210 start_codon:yes stop_codon:yes gene_type:complete
MWYLVGEKGQPGPTIFGDPQNEHFEGSPVCRWILVAKPLHGQLLPYDFDLQNTQDVSFVAIWEPHLINM